MISVIIPVYNTRDYLDRCLDSITTQSEKDLEIILVDDCSTDGSKEKLQAWADRDPRIRVIYKEKNSGVSNSRNLGLTSCKGDYITFVDSDDSLSADYLKNLLQAIEENDADIAFGRFRKIYPDHKEEFAPKKENGTILSSVEAAEYCIPPMGKEIFDGYIWDKLYRRSALIKDGSWILFDETIRFTEDCLWLVNVLLNTGRSVIVNEAVYNYDFARGSSAHHAVYDHGNIALASDGVRAYTKSYELFKDQGEQIRDNIAQRILIYRKLACRGAADAGDLKQMKELKKGYVKGLNEWLASDRSLSGFRWYCRQMAGFTADNVRCLINSVRK